MLPLPAADAVATPVGRLYTARQIAVASFLGSPAAAGWFISRNEKQLGRPQAGWLWGSFAATAVLLVAGFFLPDKFPHYVLPFAYSFGIRSLTRKLYNVPVAQHLLHGGSFGSWWAVVGISLLCLLLIVALVVGVVLLLPDNAGDASPNAG